MKKFFSLIALVGVFAACQPEKIDTTFNPDPAQVTIQMTATDLETGDDVTSQTTFTSTIGSVSGNIITIVGNPDVASGTTVTITAKYGNGSWSESFPINALAAGGTANYKFGIVVGEVKPTNAVAYINLKVWDLFTDTEVTGESTISSTIGTVTGGTVYIEGNPTIAAGTEVAITAKYGTWDPKTVTVKLEAQAAGVVKDYSALIEVGEPNVPAEAIFNISVIDNKTGRKAKDAVVTITPEIGTYSEGVYTIKATAAKPYIEAGELTIKAEYEDYEPVDTVFPYNSVATGEVATYNIEIKIGTEIQYNLEFVKGETTIVDTTFYTLKTATHAGHATSHDPYAFSHCGHSPSSWLLNDQDVILSLKTKYEAWEGYGNPSFSYEWPELSSTDMKVIDAYAKGLSQPELSHEERTYEFQVSAFAYYNCVQTVILTKTSYDVYKRGTDDSLVYVAEILLFNYASSIEAVEYAYSSHYLHGHGTGHSTHDEHGSSDNAGGGICYAD